MNQVTELLAATIHEQCRALRLPTMSSQSVRLAHEAVQQNHSHLTYLAELLNAEVDERERHTIQRCLHEARLPRMKTLEEFDFAAVPHLSAARLHELAQGGYLTRAESVILIGDAGTGKTHLATGLCVAACRQKETRALRDGGGLGQRTGRGSGAQLARPDAATLGAV